LIDERIFGPLGLKSAGFGPQASLGKVDAPLGQMTPWENWRPISTRAFRENRKAKRDAASLEVLTRCPERIPAAATAKFLWIQICAISSRGISGLWFNSCPRFSG
jgi:CubicO group peptidase (beta-lactamase class C family)